jgi:hypothetical protein
MNEDNREFFPFPSRLMGAPTFIHPRNGENELASLICDCQKLDLNEKPPRSPSHRNSNLIKSSFIFIFNYAVSIFIIFFFENS